MCFRIADCNAGSQGAADTPNRHKNTRASVHMAPFRAKLGSFPVNTCLHGQYPHRSESGVQHNYCKGQKKKRKKKKKKKTGFAEAMLDARYVAHGLLDLE